MENELVLSEHHIPQDNGGLNVQVVALVNKRTQYLDGIPLTGFTIVLKFEYHLQDLQSTAASVVIRDPAYLSELAEALTAGGYKLKEAVKKAEKGRDRAALIDQDRAKIVEGAPGGFNQ